MASPSLRRPAFIPSVVYRDQRAALEWLQHAFGFDLAGVFTDSKGEIVHAEMSHGDGIVMIGNEFTDWARSPASVGGKNTQRIHVRIDKDIDQHCAHARAAGAKVMIDPRDEFYGDRVYAAEDLEGHHWTFAQAVRNVSVEDMEKSSGFKFKEGL